MRLTIFMLSSGIALTCIPACASAQSLQPGIPPGMWVAHCPKNEGDTVCARDAKRVQRCYQHEQHHEALDTLAREGTRCAARDGAREAECSVNGE